MEKYVVKLSDGKQVNLSNLSTDDLYRLHFEEECFVANKAKELPPFSYERNEFLLNGYKLIHKIRDEYELKEVTTSKSFYTRQQSLEVITGFIKEKLQNNSSSSKPVVFYEAGVGKGYVVKELLKIPNVEIKGSDLIVTEDIKLLCSKYPNLDICQTHIIEALKKIPNNSIDIFYADNVFEHFFPDEIEVICSEISRKLKSDAYVFLIIPNRFSGPHDISRKFLPLGSKAKGFHFMEMSFSETTKMMEAHKIKHLYPAYSIPKFKIIYVKFCSKMLIKLKLTFESIIAKTPFRFTRKLIFHLNGFHISIMKKE